MSSRTLQGIGIGRGSAVGPVVRMPDPLPEPGDTASTLTADEERIRVSASLAATAADIRIRGEKAGGAAKDVLEAQAFMAEDPTLVDDITARLATGRTAERAVHEAFAGFRDLLLSMGGYMGERATDLDDVSQRVVAHLQGVAAPGVPGPDHAFVLVARDLAPADTALLDLDKVLALITTDGGPTSHTAILAREKAIVAVVGVAAAADLADGETVVVDALTGAVTVAPTPEEE
ncbi:phosphoenolpyruvate--protein phosphotransferase, partial [Clavibacter michiganensis subsp. insidiosus]